MKWQPRSERGAEIVQLAFAMPLLLLAFVATAQMMIWGFEMIQFSSAGESVAYAIDVSALEEADASSTAAKSLVQSELASRMLTDGDSVSVESVSVTATPSASAGTPIETGSSMFHYTTNQATSRVSITARLTCTSLFQIGEPLVLERTWQRDRLTYRRAEISR